MSGGSVFNPTNLPGVNSGPGSNAFPSIVGKTMNVGNPTRIPGVNYGPGSNAFHGIAQQSMQSMIPGNIPGGKGGKGAQGGAMAAARQPQDFGKGAQMNRPTMTNPNSPYL